MGISRLKSPFSACLLALCLMPCGAQEGRERALSMYLSSLSGRQRVAQIFLVNIDGSVPPFRPVEYAEDGSPLVPGGYLFFSYNIAPTAEQLISYTEDIARYCGEEGGLRPYLAVDQEGGSVNRLRGMTDALPAPAAVADAMPPSAAARLYGAQARQLRELGFDMNLAPVAEAATAANRDFLLSRSYGAAPAAMAYSYAAVCAYQGAGVGAVVKHFPGNTNTDPHGGLPEISLDARALEQTVLMPFAFVLLARPAAVLMSHARVAGFDGGTPACLSGFWIRDVLRGRLDYGGLVVSDDIFMAALAQNGFPPERAAVQAVEAGVDVIMLSEKRFAAVADVLLDRAASDARFAGRLEEAELRILSFKVRAGILSVERLPDGGFRVRERGMAEQRGTAAERLERFERAKAADEGR